LPARTAVLAAANPVGGHYNKAKTVSENLKMNPALLSRFDLVTTISTVININVKNRE
jgi:DNA helicase MCM8